jgi:thymidylate synthase
MHELLNVMFEIDLCGSEDLDRYRVDINPNLPWADNHFAERTGGHPLNPGVEWKNWPWGKSADTFREGDDQVFNHTYMERLWPRFARKTKGGYVPEEAKLSPHKGIAFEYGDLDTLVDLLVKDPHTRQAWVPLFFPEDTGVGDGGRKPCTLGYHFIVRNGRMNVWYPLRSCDLVRHFRDDCYLAVRLLIWVLEQCRYRELSYWDTIKPGTYAMHMTSLHCFENDWRQL